MKEIDSLMLKGSNRFIEGLFFNNFELNIKRNTKASLLNNTAYLLICFSLFIGCTLNYRNGNKEFFYICVYFFLIILTILILGLLKHIKARKINKMIFRFSEIRLLRVDEINKVLDLSFEFKDGMKDRISIVDNGNFEQFIEILKKNLVEVEENNKR
jgi:hypothetical protein